MKILFIGSVKFSKRCLEHLFDLKLEVVGVITREHTGLNTDHADLQPLAECRGVPVLVTQNVNAPDSLKWISKRRPDVIFCIGWSNLLKTEVLKAAPLGVIGFHPAALPANRGRHPLIWALALGLDQTATTFFFMDKGADSGDIISQLRLNISSTDDAGTLYQKMTVNALKQLTDFIPKLIEGTLKPKKQNHLLANVWRKRSKDDGLIDWRMSAKTIVNLVRALARPYPGAEFLRNNDGIKLWRAEAVMDVDMNLEPGKVIGGTKLAPIVKCGEGAIKIVECEPVISFQNGEYL